MRQQRAVAARANSIGGCVNRSSARTSREVITLLYSIFNRQHLDTMSIFEGLLLPSSTITPSPGKASITWRKPSIGHQDAQEAGALAL